MYRLVIKPRAIEMAIKAYKWFEEQREGLGELFLDDVDACYDRLQTSPELYQKINKDFRHIIVRTFPK
jgi:toxin ParE1/3/4